MTIQQIENAHHKPLGVTQQQRDNLQKLATGLRNLSPEDRKLFNMALFEAETLCGTVGCAVGFGPRLGIPLVLSDKIICFLEPNEQYVDWTRYCERVFGIVVVVKGESPWEWEFLFDASWRYYNNTPEGAADRIEYALTYGVPGKDVWNVFCV